MKKRNGQVLIVILLVMVIAVTVALSVASRTVTNIRSSTNIEEAQVAYAAAEAGIEQILNMSPDAAKSADSNTNPQLLSSGSTYQTTVTDVGGSSSDNTFETLGPLNRDDSIQMELDKTPNGCCSSSSTCTPSSCLQSVGIYWTDGGTSCGGQHAALEISQIYGYDIHQDSDGIFHENDIRDSFGVLKSEWTPSDPADDYYNLQKYIINNDCLSGSNSFSYTGHPTDIMSCNNSPASPITLKGGGTAYTTLATIGIYGGAIPCPSIIGKSSTGATVSFTNCEPRLLRIKPINCSAYVGVKAGGSFSLPLQGYKVESTGIYKDSTKKITVFKPYNSLPSVFDYVLYSGTGLSK